MLALSDVVVTLTERLLLLLGWDRIKPLRESVYESNSSFQKLKEVNQQLRKRLNQTGAGEDKSQRPTSASWEQNAPTLRPVPVATPQPRNAHASAWSSDGAAFDAAATGTV